MFFLDFLFGNQDLGHLKVLAFSGITGLILSSIGLGDAESQNRFYFILLGFPVWYLVRVVYWSYRRGELEDMKVEAADAPEAERERLNRRLKRHLDSVGVNNPELWHRLFVS